MLRIVNTVDPTRLSGNREGDSDLGDCEEEDGSESVLVGASERVRLRADDRGQPRKDDPLREVMTIALGPA